MIEVEILNEPSLVRRFYSHEGMEGRRYRRNMIEFEIFDEPSLVRCFDGHEINPYRVVAFLRKHDIFGDFQ